ncbi:myb-like protein X [Homarus americanus]|uniref:myb-like protein X n=1 Tax=Homarus americanus TaxID=6706 RepID=UPI001C45F8D4|nr:myb-like protein X [Homarus americanus]
MDDDCEIGRLPFAPLDSKTPQKTTISPNQKKRRLSGSSVSASSRKTARSEKKQKTTKQKKVKGNETKEDNLKQNRKRSRNTLVEKKLESRENEEKARGRSCKMTSDDEVSSSVDDDVEVPKAKKKPAEVVQKRLATFLCKKPTQQAEISTSTEDPSNAETGGSTTEDVDKIKKTRSEKCVVLKNGNNSDESEEIEINGRKEELHHSSKGEEKNTDGDKANKATDKEILTRETAKNDTGEKKAAATAKKSLETGDNDVQCLEVSGEREKTERIDTRAEKSLPEEKTGKTGKGRVNIKKLDKGKEKKQLKGNVRKGKQSQTRTIMKVKMFGKMTERRMNKKEKEGELENKRPQGEVRNNMNEECEMKEKENEDMEVVKVDDKVEVKDNVEKEDEKVEAEDEKKVGEEDEKEEKVEEEEEEEDEDKVEEEEGEEDEVEEEEEGEEGKVEDDEEEDEEEEDKEKGTSEQTENGKEDTGDKDEHGEEKKTAARERDGTIKGRDNKKQPTKRTLKNKKEKCDASGGKKSLKNESNYTIMSFLSKVAAKPTTEINEKSKSENNGRAEDEAKEGEDEETDDIEMVDEDNVSEDMDASRNDEEEEDMEDDVPGTTAESEFSSPSSKPVVSGLKVVSAVKPKKLTPKQLEKEVERLLKKEEREKKRLEREKKKQEELAEKERVRKEKEEERLKQKEERENPWGSKSPVLQ